MYLSVVIPVYNEKECISSSLTRIIQAFKTPLADKKIELIFVNDGSTDGTTHLLDSLKSQSTDHIVIEIIHFSRNFGHSAAVLAGLEASRGEMVAIIDADMQDPPELIPSMVQKIEAGYDVAYGVRTHREGETFLKKISAWIFYRAINILTSTHIPKDSGDFRVMTRQVVNALLKCEDRTPFIRGLVAWIGFNQVPVPYRREMRKLGQSKYPLRKMIRFAWLAISSFSISPLIFIIYLGLIMLLMSLLMGAWALRQHMIGEVIPGWTSLLLGFVAGHSITLLMLGVIGLYVGRILDQVRHRPRYLIRK